MSSDRTNGLAQQMFLRGRDDLLRWIAALPLEILRVKATALQLNQPSGHVPTDVLIGVQLDHPAPQTQADTLSTGKKP